MIEEQRIIAIGNIDILLYRNPSPATLDTLITKSGAIKVLLTTHGEILAWDASYAEHNDIITKLSLEGSRTFNLGLYQTSYQANIKDVLERQAEILCRRGVK